MKTFNLKSPNGKLFNINGETIYHAVNKLMAYENYKYKNYEYLKINKHGDTNLLKKISI